MLMSLSANAQKITFDTQDYKQLGVYDTWAESPFRTGKLKGNVGITTNFLNQDDPITGASPNQSSKMLAVQRSRFGSNTFGARIDLNETFELTTSYKYVHVMIYKPTAGRVMLVGLGKRKERAGQSPEAEQFWALGSTKVQANTWTDAVFAIKGNGGIDIYSLVVVPDCESPHELTSDYLCYIDEIEVNNSVTPRFHVTGEYGINYDLDQANPRTDRVLNGIGFSVTSQSNQSVADLNTSLLYNDKTAKTLTAKAGETVTATFNYSSNWMSGYIYADWDNNGKFEYDIESNGKPSKGSNLVAYSYYQGKNSAGASVANGNILNPPTFKIPSDLVNGFYRIRYKVDWDCIDPAGNAASDNMITNNGGAIVDVILNVHGDQCNVNDANRNGEVLAADGSKLVSYKAPFGKPFTIRMNPERGFGYMGIRVRHGYGLAGDSLVHNNPQYRDTTFSYKLFENDMFTIPDECMDGDVEIEGLFVEKSTMPSLITYEVLDEEGNILKTNKVEGKKGEPYPPHGITSQCSSEYYTLEAIPNGNISEDKETVQLHYANKFPFEVSTSLKSAKWYNLMLTASQNYLSYTTLPPMLLSETAASANAVKKDSRYLWCFVGNAFDGIKIYNAVSGETQVLSSPTTMSGTNGSSTYPILIGNPNDKREEYNAAWFVKKSSDISGKEGFYLGQMDHAANLMNLRDGNLAYWSTGADKGSTFTVNYVGAEEELLTTEQPLYKVYNDNYEMVFDDEFDEASIDDSKWVTSSRASAAWNRFISSDPRVAYLEDGNLVTKCMKNDGKYDKTGSEMISGAKQTRGKFAFTNGYVEVRAKTRQHSGNFPAIWLMPEDTEGGWPTCGEIDIWETINTENRAYQTVHSNWTYTLGHTGNPQSAHNIACIQDGEWHTYGLMKFGSSLNWYIDGIKVATYKKSDMSTDGLANGGWPYDKKFYVILNQSVGNGSWASAPDTGFTYETRFDFCHVYQTVSQYTADGHTPVCIDTPYTLLYNIERTYDLTGRAVPDDKANLRKGIYITNGKKVIKR